MRCCQCILDFPLSSASQHKSLGHFIIIAQGMESNGKMVTIWPSYPTEPEQLPNNPLDCLPCLNWAYKHRMEPEGQCIRSEIVGGLV